MEIISAGNENKGDTWSYGGIEDCCHVNLAECTAMSHPSVTAHRKIHRKILLQQLDPIQSSFGGVTKTD